MPTGGSETATVVDFLKYVEARFMALETYNRKCVNAPAEGKAIGTQQKHRNATSAVEIMPQ